MNNDKIFFSKEDVEHIEQGLEKLLLQRTAKDKEIKKLEDSITAKDKEIEELKAENEILKNIILEENICPKPENSIVTGVYCNNFNPECSLCWTEHLRYKVKQALEGEK